MRSLASQLVELLRNEVAAPSAGDDPLEQLLDFSGPTTEPEDPVLARLFPTAYPDDEEAAGEFRRFTEGALRDRKARGAVAGHRHPRGGRAARRARRGRPASSTSSSTGTAVTWMKSFTDIRLALATRLGVEEGDEDYWLALPDEDPRAHVYDIYQWVGYLQETLVDALTR